MRKLLVLLFLVGCGPTLTDRALTWRGYHKDKLMQSWGIPSGRAPLANGGELLEYVKVKTVSSGGMAMPVPLPGGPISSMTLHSGTDYDQYQCRALFTTDPTGFIVSVSTDGPCYRF